MKDVIFRVTSDETGDPVTNAAVLAAYSNKTYQTGTTDDKGECVLTLYRTDDQMMLCVAAKCYVPVHFSVVPQESENEVMVKLKPSKDGHNGVLFSGSTGHIPGISGRLNPINDGRYYVYGDNIAIGGQLAHPAHIGLGKWLHLQDATGTASSVRFLVIEGQFSLVEYTDPKPFGGIGQ